MFDDSEYRKSMEAVVARFQEAMKKFALDGPIPTC